uniref:Uncharacterized protein n=1 Tax=Strongyloides stercoralis TaxID=6248 RepID=A0A0K0ES13_STRER
MVLFSIYEIIKFTFFLFLSFQIVSTYNSIYDDDMAMVDKIGYGSNINIPYNLPSDDNFQKVNKRRLVVRVPFGRNPARGQLSRMFNSFHNVKDKKMYSGVKDLFY